MGGIMSYQDTLMNVVYIKDCPMGGGWFDIRCARCGDLIVFETRDFDEANNVKIDHENEHGIFLDTEVGEGLYYDPAEDQYIKKG
jgi:hypothetical protein